MRLASEQHRGMAVEVGGGEVGRALVLHHGVLVGLVGNPEDDDVGVSLPRLGIDGIGSRRTEEDEALSGRPGRPGCRPTPPLVTYGISERGREHPRPSLPSASASRGNIIRPYGCTQTADRSGALPLEPCARLSLPSCWVWPPWSDWPHVLRTSPPRTSYKIGCPAVDTAVGGSSLMGKATVAGLKKLSESGTLDPEPQTVAGRRHQPARVRRPEQGLDRGQTADHRRLR